MHPSPSGSPSTAKFSPKLLMAENRLNQAGLADAGVS
jgi:hypothetical protein